MYRMVLFFTLAFAFAMVPVISSGRTDGSLGAGNSTRRALTECSALNPIDTCWRCKADWADNRQTLAQCAKGFGQGTTGGQGGDIYEVTDPSDDDVVEPKEGTLRWGVTRDRPLWIIFKGDMTIKLTHELVINKDKTIDARGANVEICQGAGLTIYDVSNVIIHGLNIHDIQGTSGGLIRSSEAKPIPRAPSDGDAICVYQSTKVWIDHCYLHDGGDGLLDVTFGSNSVTVSNCKFSRHSKVMLLGADDSHAHDEGMHVTVAYNKFTDACDQRMPRCRFGFFHVVNNDYDRWGTYAIGGSAKPTIISQGNRFMAPDSPHAKNVLVRADAPESEWQTWNWRSKDDLLLNGAVFKESGSEPQYTAEEQSGMMSAEPADLVEKMCQTAGVLSCTPGQPC